MGQRIQPVATDSWQEVLGHVLLVEDRLTFRYRAGKQVGNLEPVGAGTLRPFSVITFVRFKRTMNRLLATNINIDNGKGIARNATRIKAVTCHFN